MAEIFEISDDIIRTARSAINDLVNQLGKHFQVYYPPETEECNNCLFDPINQVSTNVYRTGGTAPFDMGICPVCGGRGLKETERFDTIILLVNYNIKEWQKYRPNIVIPDGSFLAKGFIEDLGKLNNSTYLRGPIETINYMNYKFVLNGEPFDTNNIVKGRYFNAIYLRNG